MAWLALYTSKNPCGNSVRAAANRRGETERKALIRKATFFFFAHCS
jgi:hypothetical protein